MYGSSSEASRLPQMEQAGALIIGPGGKKAKVDTLLPKLSTSQENTLKKAQKYAMEQNIKMVLVQQTIAHRQQMQKQQAVSMMHRSLEQVWIKLGTIYVGSINFDITEDTVKQAFLPFGPMKNISLGYDHLAHKHKGYAFIEYEIPEAAFLAMEQMNNVMLGGRNLKVGRPSNMPQCQPVIERLREEASKYHRIYVTSIHPDLCESDLRTVFEAFGKVLSIQLSPDLLRPGKHRGYAFVEFDNPRSANEAVANMNLFDLGGQYLRVGKAWTPPNLPQMIPAATTPMPTAAAVAAAAVTAQINAMDWAGQTQGLPVPSVSANVSAPGVVIPHLTAGVGSGAAADAQAAGGPKKFGEDDEPLERQENVNKIKGSQARNVMMQKLLRRSESRVMVLKNMVGPEDLDEDLESEVTEECSKYGEVEKAIIYQEKQSEADDADVHVKIFVLFVTPAAVEKAIQSLNNRYFAGRRVQAHAYDQTLFDSGDLSG